MEHGKQNAIETDLIVIGAGPAGCAAAIWGVQKGLRVVLIEASDLTPDKPGESFHPGIFSILKMLGVHHEIEEANFLRYKGQYVNWGNVSEFQEFGRDDHGPWLGIHASRNRFESLLWKHAVAVGVDVKRPCKAITLMYDREKVTGVQTSTGLLTGKFTIDASGGRHWLSRQKGLDVNYLSHKLIAYYGYTKPNHLETEMGSFLDADAAGWTWVARVASDRFAWTNLSFHTSDRPKAVPYRLSNCTPLGLPKGANVTWRTISESAGLGYFIVGDAAGTFDPLSSDGVLRALITGIKAADLVHAVLGNKVDQSVVTDYYKKWSKELFDSEAEKLKTLYKDLLPNDYSKIYTA